MDIRDKISKLILTTIADQIIEYENAVLIDTDDTILVIANAKCDIFDPSNISSYEIRY